MIETVLTLLEVQGEGRLGDAVESSQGGLSVRPEALDAVDVAAVGGELILTMVDSQVLGVAQVDQAVVAPPAVGVDHALEADSAPNDILQNGFRAVGHELGVDLSVAFEDAEDRRFASRAPAASPADLFGPEIGLIDLAAEGAGFLTGLRHTDAQGTQQAVHGVTVEAGELCDLRGGQIGRDVADELATGRFGDPRTVDVAIFSYLSSIFGVLHPLS